jgi:hypothetical protein
LMYHYRSDVHFSQDRIDEAIRLEELWREMVVVGGIFECLRQPSCFSFLF